MKTATLPSLRVDPALREAGRYFDADEVLAGLGTQLADARKRGRRP